MNTLLIFFATCILTLASEGQTYFTTYKSPSYKTVDIQYGSTVDDSMQFDAIHFTKIQGIKDLKIHLQQITDDSSKILIYRSNKLIQTFALPFMFWHLENECLVADLDVDKGLDIKLTINGGGSGLAGELAYKIYLFSHGRKFTLLTFFDFSHEKEYDINKDGVFEILSCNHVYKGGHSYWVYNAFNFTNRKIKNISRSFNYPLWTKHLYTSRNIPATTISKKERNKEYKDLPDATIIK